LQEGGRTREKGYLLGEEKQNSTVVRRTAKNASGGKSTLEP